MKKSTPTNASCLINHIAKKNYDKKIQIFMIYFHNHTLNLGVGARKKNRSLPQRKKFPISLAHTHNRQINTTQRT